MVAIGNVSAAYRLLPTKCNFAGTTTNSLAATGFGSTTSNYQTNDMFSFTAPITNNITTTPIHGALIQSLNVNPGGEYMIRRSISPVISSANNNNNILIHVRAKFKGSANQYILNTWSNPITLNASYSFDRIAIDIRGQVENFNASSPYNYFIEIYKQ